MADYKATGTYNDAALTDEDKLKIDSLKAQYANAAAAGDTIGMEKAHSGAETVRQPYSFSGGADGSEYNPLAEQQKTKADVYHADVLPHASAQDAYINAMHDNQQKASLKALESAYDQNVIDINAAASKIPEEYQSARNKSAASYELGKANFNEYAAGSGINTGAGSQVRLSMNNQQQGDQSAINQAEATALASVETQRMKVKTQYQNDIAQAIANGELARAQALYAEHQRVDDSIVATAMNQAQLNMSAAQLNDNRQQYTQNYVTAQNQYSDAMAQQKYENALAEAKLALELGDTSKMKALGFDTSVYDLAHAANVAPVSSSGTSGSGKTAKASTMTTTLANQYAAQGLWSDDVVNALHKAGYSDEYLKSKYGTYENYLKGGNGAFDYTGKINGTPAADYEDMSSNFATVKSVIDSLISNGAYNVAVEKLQNALNTGVITNSDYARLYNNIRDRG